MVNNINVSLFSGGSPPSDESADRQILCGPLYSRCEVEKALESGQPVTLATVKCIKNVQDLLLDDEDVKKLVELAISSGQFRNSQWCILKTNGGIRAWAACDGYAVNRDEWNDAAFKNIPVSYYIKFAIGKSGSVILTISCHLSS